MSRDRGDVGAGRTGAVLVAVAGFVIAATVVFALRSLDVAAETSADAPVTTAPAVDPTATTTASTTTTVAPTTTTTTTTTTEVPVEPEPSADAGPPTYRRGASGPEVAAIQQRLVDLGYWLPAPDGNFGALTSQAVMAFQKWSGLSRDGIAGPATLAALDQALPVTAREGGDHIEVDLERQVMVIVRGDRTLAFNTSTGRQGWRTPPGRFRITREIDGVRRAELGDLYRPRYFHGGIALHGSPSIPAYPASHGCTRLTNAAVDMIWADGLAPIGTPVWVH